MYSSAFVAAVVESGGLSHIASVDSVGESCPLTGTPERRMFHIESAHTPVRRHSANQLLRERYAWRGYHGVKLPDDLSGSHFSLSATREGTTIGTMTVGFENPHVLNCEEAFAEEVHQLRMSGRRLCEFTRLAVDPGVGTKAVLAALFHVAYIVAHRLRGVDTLLMEVNPRHVRYYERMLGARVIGSERPNTKVNAPAVLLCLEFAYVKSQIERLAGKPAAVSSERSLYPLAFTRQEEAGIIARLTEPQLAPRPERTRPFVFRLPSWPKRVPAES